MPLTAASAAPPDSSPLESVAAPVFGFQDILFWIIIPVVLFYVLVIWPQQRRFRQHRSTMESLKKGEKVITAGGLVATVVDPLKAESDEILLDLGGVHVTALRSTIQSRFEPESAKKKEPVDPKASSDKANKKGDKDKKDKKATKDTKDKQDTKSGKSEKA